MYEIGSEFHYEEPAKEEDLLQLFAQFHDVKVLRCGRDAIGLIADDIICRRTGMEGKNFTAVLPALSCDSMYLPFEVRGFEVKFYALHEDLTICMEDLEKKLYGVKYPVVLTMNLYGCADQRKYNEMLRRKYPQLVLVEDVTHLLLNPELYDTESADYCIGSIRKWMGVPDGAVVISSSGMIHAAMQTEETKFTRLRAQAQHLKADYLDLGDPELKTRFRGMLSEAENSLEDGRHPHEMTALSREFLSHVDLSRMRYRRSVNYHCLYSLLRNMTECGQYFRLLPEVPEEIAPFTLPVILNPDRLPKGQSRDAFERCLAARGVYAPVLWPIDDRARSACAVSAEIADQMLAFWIDQRYDRFDMEHVAEVFHEELLGAGTGGAES